MNTDSVSLLKHLPFCLLCISLQFDKGSHCTRGTFFGFSSPSLGFGAACWKGGGGDVTDKFHFMPTTIMALLFQRGGFVCKPLSGEKKKKKDEKEQSWLHVTLNQQDTCQCLLRSLLLLSWLNFNALVCSTFPFFIDVRLRRPTHTSVAPNSGEWKLENWNIYSPKYCQENVSEL